MESIEIYFRKWEKILNTEYQAEESGGATAGFNMLLEVD